MLLWLCSRIQSDQTLNPDIQCVKSQIKHFTLVEPTPDPAEPLSLGENGECGETELAYCYNPESVSLDHVA